MRLLGSGVVLELDALALLARDAFRLRALSIVRAVTGSLGPVFAGLAERARGGMPSLDIGLCPPPVGLGPPCAPALLLSPSVGVAGLMLMATLFVGVGGLADGARRIPSTLDCPDDIEDTTRTYRSNNHQTEPNREEMTHSS